ncbi:MAG: murein biosynthesis integral membrane protein MurJ [Deltaproteobacteria bacterium]|nr:murein biosynthesis integral membrane protein MurJ [Deltaproteobacteria bacterium]MBW2071836.1 murein biosynthesis integral membrane protein MurJ [Deltaproteobacteria bacterium]
MQDKNTDFYRPAALISGLTLVSRILGFARDVVIAYVLGASVITDVFFVAFRIPNLFRRLYADGFLSLPFMHAFGRSQVLADGEAFRNVSSSLFCLTTSIYTAVLIVGELAAPVLVAICAPGFIHAEAEYNLTVSLTRLLLPYILLIGATGFFMAVLNSRDHFAAPAAAPALLNVSMIAALLLGQWFMAAPVWALSWGVLIGGLLQLLLQLPRGSKFISMQGCKQWWRHHVCKQTSRIILPTVLGAAVNQLNIFVATMFASFLAAGSISFLYYGERLMQFPLGIFASAVATSVMPTLTRHNAAMEWAAFRQQLVEAIEILFFFTIPAAAGLWILREPLIRLVLERGEFGAAASSMTAEALGYYALGLWAVAGCRLLVAAWYALNRPYVPFFAGLAALTSNVLLCLALVESMGLGGLALATSLAAAIQLVILLALLVKRLQSMETCRLLGGGLRCLLASALMALLVHYLYALAIGSDFVMPGNSLLPICGCILVGVFTYLGIISLLGLPPSVKNIWQERLFLGKG